MTRSIVVIGTGMAAQGFVSEIVACGSGTEYITMIDENREPPINKAHIQSVLAGRRCSDDIFFHSAKWFNDHNVSLRLGRKVVETDKEKMEVRLSDGSSLPYDDLVQFNPGRVQPPPVFRSVAEFVFTLGTAAEIRQIESRLNNCNNVLLVGGGIVAIETSLTLAARGISVEIVTSQNHLLGDILDSVSTDALRLRLEAVGVKIRTSTSISSFFVEGPTSPNKGTTKVVFNCGADTHVDMVIATTLPPKEFLQMSIAEANSDCFAREIGPNEMAICDCGVPDTWNTTDNFDTEWDQGARLAKQLLNKGHQSPVNSRMVRIASSSLNVAIYSNALHPDEGELIELQNRVKHTYKRFRIRQGDLADAVIIGDDDAVERLIAALATKSPLINPYDVFFGTSTPDASMHVTDDVIICTCNKVTKRKIVDVVRQTLPTTPNQCVSQVVRETQVTTGCGGCSDLVNSVVNEVFEDRLCVLPESDARHLSSVG